METTGSFLLFKQVIPQMIQQQWGRVVNFTGLDAFNGADVMSSATEMGLVGLTRGIAREYGKYNITANCIGPGGRKQRGCTRFRRANETPYPVGALLKRSLFWR